MRPPIQPGVSAQAAAEVSTDTSTATTDTTAATTVQNNPLYTPTKTSGDNPLHRNHKSSFTDATKPLVNLTGK